ncbi:MAG TPA: flavodoxin domain-containing protein [Myxococcaceae bacterium]|jgi:menaquinone-dependent protoporphyrinogen oxidase
MKPFLVVYASRSGHTRRLAEGIADRVRTLGHEVQTQDVRTEALPLLERYAGVLLAASVHLGHHEREMAKFVRSRRGELDVLPTVFFSVSLTEAAAEDVHRPDQERVDARRAVGKILEDFVLETGWRPQRAVPIAGALTEGGQGPLTRLLLRAVARQTLLDDLVREVTFTDRAALNREVDQLVRAGVSRSRSAPSETVELPPFQSAVEGAVLAP